MPILYLSGVFEIIARFGPLRKIRTIQYVDSNAMLESSSIDFAHKEISTVI